jgi:hypothetical protein
MKFSYLVLVDRRRRDFDNHGLGFLRTKIRWSLAFDTHGSVLHRGERHHPCKQNDPHCLMVPDCRLFNLPLQT